MIRILGAVLAGGRARRFGSDKALAELDGVSLIDRSIASLEANVSAVAVVGREHGSYLSLADWPLPGLGPLGGLCAALRYGAANGFTAVLSTACDIPQLPEGMLTELLARSRAGYAAAAPVVGYWPCFLADDLSSWLQFEEDDLSVRAWAADIGAQPFAEHAAITNVNRPEDLDRLRGKPLS